MDLFVGGGLNGIFLWFHQSFAGGFQMNLAPMLVFLSFIFRLGFSIRHCTTPIFYQFGLPTIYAPDCANSSQVIAEATLLNEYSFSIIGPC
jgi:hypothetical protein